jgi:hypothetical protein
MLCVNANNVEAVKEFKFSLRAFVNITLDIPVERSIELFGYENTYRFNKNLTLEDLPKEMSDISTRNLTMCFHNKALPHADLIEHYGEKSSILINRWERILATKDKLADVIMEDYHKLRLHRVTPEIFHKVLKRIKEETPFRLFEMTKMLTRINSATNLAELAILLPNHLPHYYYDALVLDEEAIQKLKSDYIRYPRVASLLLSNLPEERWGEIEIPDDVAVGANVIINLGLNRDYTEYDLWEGESEYNPIVKMPDTEKLLRVIDSPKGYHLNVLGNFEPKTQAAMITSLLERSDVDERLANDLLALALELVYKDLEFSPFLSEQLIAFVMGNHEQRGYWKLYLSTNLKDEYKETILGRLRECHEC